MASNNNSKKNKKKVVHNYEQDPYDRPTGTIPGTEGPASPFGTPYPPFENRGTEQPKVNLRFDYDTSEDTFWVFSGGYAATDGIMHSGIGPFDIESDTLLGYVKAEYLTGDLSLKGYVNVLDGLTQMIGWWRRMSNSSKTAWTTGYCKCACHT